MKRFAFVALLLASFATVQAQAAPKTKTTKRVETKTVETKQVENKPAHDAKHTDTVRTSSSGSSVWDSSPTTFSISGPLTLLDGSAYWGVAGTIKHEFYPALFAAIDTGLHFRSGAWFFPIMPAIYYNVPLDMGSNVTPFIGLSMGLAISHSSVTVLTTTVSDTSAQFDMLFHFGANFGQEQKIFADVKLGVLGGAFQFSPAIGYNF